MKVVVPDGDVWGVRRRAALGFVPLAVLALSVVMTLAGFRLLDGVIRHDQISSFNLLAVRQVSTLQQNLDRNIETVYALGGLFDASESVSRREFGVFSEQMLSRASGVQALSWNPLIKPGQLDDVKRLARLDGLDNFDFFQSGPDGKPESLTARSDYVAVLYIEPYGKNRKALGYDVGSDPIRRDALNQARDTGRALSSGPVKLVQSLENEFGFLIFRPVYFNGRSPETVEDRRRLIQGFVVGVYNVSSILAGALDAAIPARTRVTIFDGEGDVGSLTPVFDTQGPHVGSSQGRPVRIDGAFVHTAQLTLPMRTWTVVVRPSENFSSPIERAAEYMFLVAGLAGSLLVYGLLVSSRMRNTMIEWNVENRTRELAAEIVERKAAEAALKRSERTYAKLTEMAPIGILIFKDRKVDQANLAASRLLGAASPQELIGRSRLEFLRPEDVDGATRRWELVKEGRDLPVWEVETVRLDGVSFPSLIRTEQVNIDGHIYAIVVLEDVSLVRRAAQAIKDSEEKYRSLIEFFPQGVLLTEKGNITQINPAGLRLYGAETEADILGRDWISLVEESHRDRMSQRRQMMSEGNRVESTELELLRLDGTSFWVRAQAMPVDVSGKIFYMTVFADITDRKLADQEIQRATRELVRSNNDLAQFAYVASHDLKEPLRMVSSYCGLIADRYADKLDENGQKFIFYATDGAKRMQALIDDLLLYSRVGRGGETEEHVDLSGVVGDVLNVLSERIAESGATITVGGLPVVAGFRTELFRLFQNLLSNAIKFRSDAPLKIEINCREDDAGATILVADNGIGVMPEHRDKIFGVFQRLHRRELYEGTGIGLAICVKIVEQMGGDITIEGNEGGGSIFVFTLPHSRLPGRQVLD